MWSCEPIPLFAVLIVLPNEQTNKGAGLASANGSVDNSSFDSAITKDHAQVHSAASPGN